MCQREVPLKDTVAITFGWNTRFVVKIRIVSIENLFTDTSARQSKPTAHSPALRHDHMYVCVVQFNIHLRHGSLAINAGVAGHNV